MAGDVLSSLLYLLIVALVDHAALTHIILLTRQSDLVGIIAVTDTTVLSNDV